MQPVGCNRACRPAGPGQRAVPSYGLHPSSILRDGMEMLGWKFHSTNHGMEMLGWKFHPINSSPSRGMEIRRKDGVLPHIIACSGACQRALQHATRELLSGKCHPAAAPFPARRHESFVYVSFATTRCAASGMMFRGHRRTVSLETNYQESTTWIHTVPGPRNPTSE